MSSRQPTPDTPISSTVPTPTFTNDYVSLNPCSHLSQVLRSSAKDTALRNYGLAVKVICFTNTSTFSLPTYQSKDHKSKPLEKAKLMKLRSKVLKCKDCYVNIGNTCICLQCPHVGCLKNRHFINHAKTAGHVFG